MLGAAALAAAGLLLAPGEARAETECGAINLPILTCSNAAYNNGIRYISSTINLNSGSTVRVPGRSTGPTTITTGSQEVGIALRSSSVSGLEVYVGGATGGTDHVVNIVQGTNSGTGANQNNGIYVRQYSVGSPATVEVRSGVTIGSSTTPMKRHGIFFYLRAHSTNFGQGAGGGTLTNAATIHAARQGIRVFRESGGTNAGTTITNTGAIFSGVGNPSATAANYDAYRDNLPHGILAFIGGTQRTGSMSVTNSGDITLGGAYVGILMQNWGAGGMSLDNRGDIGAVAGQTARRGIQFDFEYWDNQSAQAVTLTNSGDITAADFGIRLKKVSGGAVALTNSGRVTATAEAAQHTGHAIYLVEGVTFGDGRTYAANSGALTVDNRGVLSSKNHALYVFTATADDDVELENSGAVTSEDGDGIRIERVVEGDVAVENSANVSGKWRGIYVGKAARIDFDQTGGTITSGRTGVYAGVSRESAMGDTRSVDGDGNHVPAIDVAWTGGSIARGTAENDDGRFRAATAAQVLAFDRESAAVKAVEGTLHYGGPAGIEAHALSWRDVAAQVAKGDDPGAVADNAAQLTAVPMGATAGDNAYVAQLRAALGNDDLAVATAVFEAIDSSATSLDDVTDAEIVAYLRTDAAAIRAVLRNVLAQGLSDDEKAILRAVATNDGVDAALTAAGFTDDTSDDSDYWSLVKALLDRHNLDDVRVNVTAGSIDSRGDGIRAYYATPNANNGGISVTVAEGVSVTGGAAGVYVANAGEGLMLARKYTPGYAPDDTADERVAVMHGEGADAVALRNQLVTVAGTVTGGTDAAVHLNGGGAVIVEEGGKVHAGSSGVAIKVNDPGPALVHVEGEVKGGAGGAAAVHLTGGGSVVVGLNGRVQANGADNAIQGGGDAATMVALTLATARMIEYREDAEEAYARVEGSVEGVESVVRLREYRDGVFTGYSTPLTVTDGALDTSGLEWGPCSEEGHIRSADGVCGPPPPPPGDGSDGPGSGDDGSEDGGSGDDGSEDDGSGDGSESGPGAPTPTFSCAGAGDDRCRLYEALPSMLLAMNALPSWAERASAARGANGVWGRVEAARGEWRAKKATTETPAGKLAYDHRRTAGHAGVDFAAGESGRVGLSVHALEGKAEMGGVGEVALNALGGGLSATRLFGDLYVDAQAALTLYDVDFESYTHGKLRKAASGVGYALGVELGRRMPVGGTFVTPRAGLAWSQADFSDFADDYAGFEGGPRARVSVEDARSLKGRLGVMVETEAGMGAASGRLYGSLDVEQELSDETEVKVGGQVLKTEVRPTSVRLGAGGVFDVGERVVVRATAGYRTSGSGASGYGGGLEVQVRF